MRSRILTVLVPGALTALIGLGACQQDEQVAGPDDGTTAILPGGTPGGGCGGTKCDEAGDRMTGGGKLGEGRDFATLGFNVRPGQGQLEWQQHCLDGITGSPTCAYGGFSFHGSTVTFYGSAPDDPEHCRTWTGSGELKLRDPALAAQYDGTYEFRVDRACDNGEPGHGTDYISFTLASYHREGLLTGGNLQLHPDRSGGNPHAVTMEVTSP